MWLTMDNLLSNVVNHRHVAFIYVFLKFQIQIYVNWRFVNYCQRNRGVQRRHVDFNTDHNQANDVATLAKAMSDNLLVQGAWHIVGVDCQTVESYKKARAKSMFLYQVGKVMYVVHQCRLYAPFKCKCANLLALPGVIDKVVQGRQNYNVLKSNSAANLFADILTVIEFSSTYPHVDNRKSVCFFAQVSDIKFPLGDELKQTLRALRKKICNEDYDENSIKNIGVVGRCLSVHLHGEFTRADNTRSSIEIAQAKLAEKRDTWTYLQVLSGAHLTDQSHIKILNTPPSQISCAVYRILQETRPKPLEAVTRTGDWQASVYAHLSLKQSDVADGIERFREDCLRMTTFEYLTDLASRNPNKMVLSSTQSRVYMSVDDSVKFMMS